MGQKPGAARTGKGSLITGIVEKGKYIFNDKDIFKTIESPEEIAKYYSPVNYASELNNSYKKLKGHFAQDSLKDRILKYCNMYFVASVIYCINNRNVENFSNFIYIDIKHNDAIVQKFIELFESYLIEIDKKQIDSNDFKKEDLYRDFKGSKQMKDLYDYLSALKTNR